MIKDFDKLKQEMRQHESDLKRDVKTGTAKMMTTEKKQDTEDETDLKAMIQQMAADIQVLKQERNQQFQHQKSRGNWRGRGDRNHIIKYNRYSDQNQQQNTRSSVSDNQDRQNSRQYRSQEIQRQNNNNQYQEVTCWRCGQKGHLKVGCRVRMDHSRKSLNRN